MNEFPANGILPKEEIGATDFLRQYPEFDGRGIVVAIFDTGVDVGVEGLRNTTDGKRKVIDAIDATGSGDIDMREIATATPSGADEDGDDKSDKDHLFIEGLTGRRFKIDPSWNNQSKKYRVGIKRIYDLFPSPLKNRLVQKRSEKFYRVQHEKVTAIQQSISQCGTDDEGKKRKMELEGQIDRLNEMAKTCKDPGPLVDCIMWQDDSDKEWRVVVYTAPDMESEWQQMINVAKKRAKEKSEDENVIDNIIDLTGHRVLQDYVLHQDYDHFSNADNCNYNVKIYEDGDILSLVTCSGSHGTHVAGIVGAHYPDNPELNGVAPGVQLISVKIGDSRLASMETGTGIARGVIAAAQHKVDVINMSYGEGTTAPNTGRFKRMVNELVHKHNVVFVSSAGNNGPALSTLGCPGGDFSSMIGVGAYVSPSMMSAQYNLLEKLPENQYSWSSRGPRPDGHHGISVSACGGAIAPVPEYQLAKNQLMNGTSMSSPCCSGGIALLLSGFKAHKKTWNPFYIKTLIQNTARGIPSIDPLALGCGLLQVDKAFTHSETHAFDADQNVHYTFSLPERKNARGVYLRDYYETQHPLTTRVTVTPKFHEDVENDVQIKFEKRFRIETTKEWIKAPEYLLLANGAKNIQIRVDPTSLAEGKETHFGEILFLESGNERAGPIIRVPVTVTKPLRVEEQKVAASSVLPEESNDKSDEEKSAERPSVRCVLNRSGLRFQPGHIDRLFVQVPRNANMVKIKFKAMEMENKRVFYVHLMQLVDHENLHDTEMKKLVSCTRDDIHTLWFHVMPERTLELCVAQFWSSLGESVVDIDLEFIGVHLLDHGETIHLNGSDVIKKLSLQTSLRSLQTLNFKCSLTELRQHFRPQSSEIKAPKDKRNMLMNGKQVFELINTYEFDVKEASDCYVIAPALDTMLYENEFESQLRMIFNGNKKLIHVVDAFSRRYKFKLGKGNHTVLLQIRHESLEKLEKMKQFPIIVAKKLAKSIPISLYKNRTTALLGTSSGRVEKQKLYYGRTLSLFAAAPNGSALPKDAKPGDRLCGSLSVKKHAGNAESFSFEYTIPTKSKDDTKTDETKDLTKKLETLDTRPIEEKLQEAVLDQKIKFANSLLQASADDEKKRADFTKVLDMLLSRHDTDNKVLQLKLKSLNELKVDKEDERAMESKAQEIIDTADQIVKSIDLDALSIHLATRPKTKDSSENSNDFADEQELLEYKKLCKEMDKQKAFIVSALKEKLLCLLKRKTPSDRKEEHDRLIKSTMRQLRQYQDTSTENFLSLETAYELHFGRHGNVLQKVNKALGNGTTSTGDKTLADQRIKTLIELGWDHWVANLSAWRLVDFPNKFPLL